MLPSTSTISPPRMLLLHTPSYKSPGASPFPNAGDGRHSTESSMLAGGSFEANVVMILSVLLCALVCALGLNSILRCALRCSNRTSYEAAELANAGVKKKALRALPEVTYSPELKLAGSNCECAICLSDFEPGEIVRVLPKCSHGFHVKCIDRWLTARSSCPTCRQCLFGTCQKISGCAAGAAAVADEESQQGQLQSIIVPLEPEGLIANHI